MSQRQDIITELGKRLEAAARASIAKGATYKVGDHIDRDSDAAWAGVAESLVSLVETAVRRGGRLDDGQQATNMETTR